MIRRILVGEAGTPATEAKIAFTGKLGARHDASVSATSVIDAPVLVGTHDRKAILGKRSDSTILDTLKTSTRPVFMTH